MTEKMRDVFANVKLLGFQQNFVGSFYLKLVLFLISQQAGGATS